MNEELEMITKELFERDAVEIIDDPTTDNLYDSLVEKAHAAIEKYGWEAVFESWDRYMRTNCHTTKEALSFATWFVSYGGEEHVVTNPYVFLAYLYDIFDLNPVKYDAQIMDDLSFGLLETAGIKKDLWTDDSYTTETDPELIAAVAELRKGRVADGRS